MGRATPKCGENGPCVSHGGTILQASISPVLTVLFGVKESLKRSFDYRMLRLRLLSREQREGRRRLIMKGRKKIFVLGGRNCKPGGENVIVNAVNIMLLDRVVSQVLLAS